MSKIEKPQGMKVEKLFEQFTKSNTIIQNSFQIVYDGMKQLAEQNEILQKENAILKGEAPKVAKSVTEEKPKNRAERRKIAKKQKKK